jgi:hypothetical protein
VEDQSALLKHNLTARTAADDVGYDVQKVAKVGENLNDKNIYFGPIHKNLETAATASNPKSVGQECPTHTSNPNLTGYTRSTCPGTHTRLSTSKPSAGSLRLKCAPH